jgi:ABC-type nitrate/sulfonate/bicarbonate transport system permease component
MTSGGIRLAESQARDPGARPLVGDAGRARRGRERWLRPALGLAGIAVILGGWQLSSLWLNPVLFSTPSRVAAAYPYMFQSGALGQALLATLSDWAISVGIGLAGGLLIGALMGRYRWFERLLNPFVDFLIATPRVVLIPLLIVWIGVGSEGRIIFAVLTNIFVVIINTMAGVRNVNAVYTDAGRAAGLSDRQVTWKIRVPGAMPYILAGARLCASVSLVGLIIAQMEFSNAGLGYLLQIYQARLETSNVLAVVAVTAVIGLAIVGLFKAIERLLFGWVRETSAMGRA